MNRLIFLLDTSLPDKVTRIGALLHISISKLIVSLGLLLLAYIINWLLRKPIKKWIKIRLYRRRGELFYRLLYFHIDKIIRPIRVLITLLIIKQAIIIFTIDETIDTLFFSLYWIMVFWIFYESIKFILYLVLHSKIKQRKTARMELYNLSLNIMKIFIVLILIMLILSHLGIDLTALITSLGIGGAIIGLSAKDTLMNFFDSIRLISEDAFRQGDWIETRDVEGFVTEMGITSTKIRTFDNSLVTVPNSKLVNDYVKNWSRRMVGRRIKFHLKLKYTYDMDEVSKVVYEIYDMLHKHPDIVNDNKITYLKQMKMIHESGLFNLEDKYGVRRTLLVYLDKIDTYSLDILVYAFSISVNWEEWLRVKQDIIKKIIKIIEESDLELAIPEYEIKNLVELESRKGILWKR